MTVVHSALPITAKLCARHNDSNGQPVYLIARRALRQTWLDDADCIDLLLVYRFEGAVLQSVLVCDRIELLPQLTSLISRPEFSLNDFALRENLPLLDPAAILRLRTVSVPKPWGQEIWYTGIEQRGVSEVETLAANCPLPWVQAALGEAFSGLAEEAAPVLLKILDPHPEPVIGDLYFELHQVKQEVYVVTSVDESAWPDGIGRIRIGFNPAKREAYGSIEAFKRAYSLAVASYRKIRVEVDDWLDKHCPTDGNVMILDDAKIRLASVPSDLAAKEKALRAEMEAFTQLHELRVGDVVTIPRCLPHALQHGVRAVEFQTPVYERKIVSFAQKVLTQSHWDTDEALLLSNIEDYAPQHFEVERRGDCTWQRIVAFEDFEVWRAEIDAGKALQLPTYTSYQLLMPVSQSLNCNGSQLDSEQAVLLLKSLQSVEISNPHSVPVKYLLARPLTADQVGKDIGLNSP